MADLPHVCFGYQAPVFHHVGVDYFGPILVRSGRKTEQRYGALFTCMTTHAVHIEIANSLETDARRGKPAHVWSDNGTNFVGAEKEIREAIKKWNKEHRVQWHFNPPASPHFGGIWERLVRSSKSALKAIAGNQRVNDETLLTFMVEAESLLNSRPLTSVSGDARDLEALTPNHSLVGRANLSLPLDIVIDEDLCSRKGADTPKLCSSISGTAGFLEQRGENRSTRNVREGDLVLMIDEHSPRGHWLVFSEHFSAMEAWFDP